MLKSRSYYSGYHKYREYDYHIAAWGPWMEGFGRLSTETSDTVNHGHLNGRWAGGGAWKLTRTLYSYPGIGYFNNGVTLQGNFIANNYTGASPVTKFSQMSTPQSVIDGTTAFKATIPTNPSFDLANAIGELRLDGIPSPVGFNVWRDQTLRAKHAGDEYLNIEFGWLPLVSSIRDFSRTVSETDKIVTAYQQDANKSIKRTFEWPEETRVGTSTGIIDCHPQWVSLNGTAFYRHSQKRWFEADYQYFLPIGGSAADKISRYAAYARKLYGLELTPELVWNLTPWSWAADWVGNVGDILHNLSRFSSDGLVARHAYLMCHTRNETLWHATYKGSSVSRLLVEETKQRFPSSPFGFGVAFTGITPTQAAVVTALGLSRW